MTSYEDILLIDSLLQATYYVQLIVNVAYLFQGDVKNVQYPSWCYFIIAFLICASCFCVPAVFLLRLYQRVTARRRRDTEIVRDLLESSTTKKPSQENAG